MLLSRHQNPGQIHDRKIGNRCFENVAQFRYLGIEWDDMDWIILAQDRDQWRVLLKRYWSFGFHKMLGKFLSSCKTGGFSRRAQLHE
jgi:hypothetical protein